MTPADLDLIEAAAKAVGYETVRRGPLGLSTAPAEGLIPRAIADNTMIVARRDGKLILWDPLRDDAQNLGLQQHLRMKVGCTKYVARAQVATPHESTPYAVFEELIESFPVEVGLTQLMDAQVRAIRRATVRAAAHLVRRDPNCIAASKPL